MFKLENVLLLKLCMYVYIYFIFESEFIAHDVKPGFVNFVVHADFRVVNVGILSLCPLFYLCRWMSYSYYKHAVKIKMIKIYIYIYSCVGKQKIFCFLKILRDYVVNVTHPN